MYFVGIDISKYKHDCFITTETDVVIQNLSFKNNKDGFEEFLKILNFFNFFSKKYWHTVDSML